MRRRLRALPGLAGREWAYLTFILILQLLCCFAGPFSWNPQAPQTVAEKVAQTYPWNSHVAFSVAKSCVFWGCISLFLVARTWIKAKERLFRPKWLVGAVALMAGCAWSDIGHSTLTYAGLLQNPEDYTLVSDVSHTYCFVPKKQNSDAAPRTSGGPSYALSSEQFDQIAGQVPEAVERWGYTALPPQAPHYLSGLAWLRTLWLAGLALTVLQYLRIPACWCWRLLQRRCAGSKHKPASVPGVSVDF